MDLVKVIKKVAPRAKKEYIEAIENGDELFKKAGITTPLRKAHFLAQILHESGGLTITFENMNYKAKRIMEIFGVGRHSARITESESKILAGNPESLAERAYGLGNPKKAKELGNTKPGDGYKFRGGGILQTTGKGSYIKYGKKIDVDLENFPELIVSSENALKPALFEWTEKGCNKFADINDIGSITRKINGGTNGLADRKLWFNKVWNLIKDETDEEIDLVKSIKSSADVKFVQESLNELGVVDPELNVDGKLGPKTVEAIKIYQRLNRIPVDGDPGNVTIESIKQSLSARKNSIESPEKGISKSTIAMGSTAGGVATVVQLISETKDVSDQLSSIKDNVDNTGLFSLLNKLMVNPTVLISIIILLIFGFILYRRYIMKHEVGV